MSQNPLGANAPLGEVPLGPFGAPDFTLSERLDMSGHKSGRVDPHLNTDVLNPSGTTVARDLTNTQIPGMNGMQNP
jgi:hypothetical protein